MRTWSPGQVLLLVVFLLVPLLNFLLTLWRRRRRAAGTTGRQLEPVMQEAPAQATPLRSVQAARVRVSGERPRQETPRVPAEVPRGAPRLKVSARLGPRDAHRGVVLIAILGPCRALEPWQPEARGPGVPHSSPADAPAIPCI